MLSNLALNTTLIMIILFLCIASIILSGVTLYLLRKHQKFTEKRITELESTFGYFEFLDNANMRLYREHLKEKAKKKKKSAD